MWLNCRPVDDETRGQQVSEGGDALLNVPSRPMTHGQNEEICSSKTTAQTGFHEED